MAINKPTLYPRWASDPPVAPPTTITEPSSDEQDEGFQPNVKPKREYFNWLFSRAFEWIRYFDVAGLRWGDIGDDFDVVGYGAPPSAGSTLVGTEGVALSYISGRRAVSETNAAQTYTAERDTYVDLTLESELTYTEVINDAAAPAIAAGSRRQWKVVTDATDITDVVDLRTDGVNVGADFGDAPWTFRNAIKLGTNLLSSAAKNALARLDIPFAVAANRRTLIFKSFRGDGSDGYNYRVYRAAVGVSGNIDVVEHVFHASWDEDTDRWVPDRVTGDPHIVQMSIDGVRAWTRTTNGSPFKDEVSADGWNREDVNLHPGGNIGASVLSAAHLAARQGYVSIDNDSSGTADSTLWLNPGDATLTKRHQIIARRSGTVGLEIRGGYDGSNKAPVNLEGSTIQLKGDTNKLGPNCQGQMGILVVTGTFSILASAITAHSVTTAYSVTIAPTVATAAGDQVIAVESAAPRLLSADNLALLNCSLGTNLVGVTIANLSASSSPASDRTYGLTFTILRRT